MLMCLGVARYSLSSTLSPIVSALSKLSPVASLTTGWSSLPTGTRTNITDESSKDFVNILSSYTLFMMNGLDIPRRLTLLGKYPILQLKLTSVYLPVPSILPLYGEQNYKSIARFDWPKLKIFFFFLEFLWLVEIVDQLWIVELGIVDLLDL
uniref:Uncharacterized protein n=1 Tax=Cacopsylla melanoneura TaxID=428564 RepID=A0A8D9B8D8_9HEMI